MATNNAVNTSLAGQTGTGVFVGGTAPTMSNATIDNINIHTNTISSTNSNGNINIIPNGTGFFNVGTSTALNSSLMTLAENNLSASLSIGGYTNNASGPTTYYVKSRNTTVGGNTAVQANDALMTITSYSSDGTTLIQNSEIITLATGTISAGIVPSLMQFQTMNTSGQLLTSLTLNADQSVAFGTAAGVPGKIIAYSPTSNSGSLGVTAANSAGNFANVLTNASTSAARTWTLPDSSGTIALTSGSTQWSNISGTTQTAVVNSGYVIGNAGQTTVTLPVTAALGSIVAVQGQGAAGWILAAGVGQTIKYGQQTTSSGGSLTSAHQYDSIEVVCIVANTTWGVRFSLSTGLTVA